MNKIQDFHNLTEHKINSSLDEEIDKEAIRKRYSVNFIPKIN
jgi:hypothetical protein